MFARVLEMKTKRGQARALCAAAEKEILPIVKKYPGYLDVTWMIPDESPDSVLAISFWQNKDAAEKFRMEGYTAVSTVYERFTEADIDLRNCDVVVAPALGARAAKASGAGR